MLTDGKIVKVPTIIVPGDMIIPTKILSEEDTLTFTTEQYLHSFNVSFTYDHCCTTTFTCHVPWCSH